MPSSTASLLIPLLGLLSLGATPRAKPESIADLVARIPAEKGEFETTAHFRERLAALAGSHWILVPTTPTYDADRQQFVVELPVEVSRDVRRRGKAVGTTPMNVRFGYLVQDITTITLKPTVEEALALLRVPCPADQARAMKGDLQVVLEFRLAPAPTADPQPVSEGALVASPLRTSTSHHTAALDSPWDGTLREHILHIEVVEVAAARRSTGQLLLARSGAEVIAARELRVKRAKEELEATIREEREALERAERARLAAMEREQLEKRDRRWPLDERMAYEKACVAQFPPGMPSVDQLCQCNLEEAERAFPKRPPAQMTDDSRAKLAAGATRCMKNPMPRGRPIDLYFKPPGSPAHAWADWELAAYLASCEVGGKQKYGEKRTAAQIRYACECVAWNLQDNPANYVTLVSSDPAAATRLVEQVSADCKARRPPDLGPDPG